jgi:ubiquinone/menaquinone biosynthesis C-methylase UbiE
MNFDAIARPYRWLEYLSFGPLLEQCRFAQIDRLGNPRHALILGDGDGRFVARLLARYPHLKTDIVDLSPAMIQLAQQRLRESGSTGRARFYIADIRTFTPPATYDLVASHFFLDCLTDVELEEMLLRLDSSIEPGAAWVVSEFAIPPQQPLRAVAQTLIATLYFAFRVLAGLETQQLPDHPSALERAGFTRENSTPLLGGILRSEIWIRHRTT